MHQAFHHVGLEVHDPVPADLPLAPGQVLAVEPAIYLPSEALEFVSKILSFSRLTGSRFSQPEFP
jgi:hypothetical protein